MAGASSCCKTIAIGLPGGQAASPWHAGELAMQRRVGVADRMDAVGRRNIRNHLIDQHQDFFRQLPFVVAGAVDRDGDAWATLLAGRPGFLQSPDALTLRVMTQREPGDPADTGLNDGSAICLLGLEPSTRRRDRLNGTVHRTGEVGFDVNVAQSYGNCPQYIRQRDSVRSAGVRGGGLTMDAVLERSRTISPVARCVA